MMIICLKSVAKQSAPMMTDVTLTDRLPFWIKDTPTLVCRYRVDDCGDYDRLTVETTGQLLITCQRCLAPVEHAYQHVSELLVCRTEEDADRLMAMGECIVSQEGMVDLNEILTDDLYLYSPEKPHETAKCDVND